MEDKLVLVGKQLFEQLYLYNLAFSNNGQFSNVFLPGAGVLPSKCFGVMFKLSSID